MLAYTAFYDASEEVHLFPVLASLGPNLLAFHCLCLSTDGAAVAALVVGRARLAAELPPQRSLVNLCMGHVLLHINVRHLRTAV